MYAKIIKYSKLKNLNLVKPQKAEKVIIGLQKVNTKDNTRVLEDVGCSDLKIRIFRRGNPKHSIQNQKNHIKFNQPSPQYAK